MNTFDKVQESNRIERIIRDPSLAEMQEFDDFMGIDEVKIRHLENFVSIYQPGAVLRTQPGQNVRIGHYIPPLGGIHIIDQLQALLDEINDINSHQEAWELHIEYEILHPFTDGNGRSGRMLWYWMMFPSGARGFLHEFYYQTLRARQRNSI